MFPITLTRIMKKLPLYLEYKMKYLLDTHILLWALTDNKKLPAEAQRIITDDNNEIFASVASLWEITIKNSIHPENMPFNGIEVSQYCKNSDIKLIDIKEKHIVALPSLHRENNAPKHNDPFDKIMLCQAKVEEMIFISCDTLLPAYNESCLLSLKSN